MPCFVDALVFACVEACNIFSLAFFMARDFSKFQSMLLATGRLCIAYRMQFFWRQPDRRLHKACNITLTVWLKLAILPCGVLGMHPISHAILFFLPATSQGIHTGCIQYRMQFYFFCPQHHKPLIRLASNTACNFIFSPATYLGLYLDFI